jgi:hypothetical protein
MVELAQPSRWRRLSAWLISLLIAPAPVAGDPLPQTCAACGADCACPLDWEPEDSEHWWIRVRCGECGHAREIVLENAAAAHFEVHLAWQSAKIERALDVLDRERMAAEIELFVAALDVDLVDAGDFA